VDDVDKDVLGMYREGEMAELALLYVRSGKLGEVATFSLKNAEIPDEELVAAFLAQHYGREGDPEDDVTHIPIPEEIAVPVLPEGSSGIAEWLSDRAGHKVSVIHPQRGPRMALLAMANDNAKHAFTQKRRESDDVEERLKQLQERLRLPSVPHRIECCDISHLGGGDTVGAVVAMKDGLPDKKQYRTFHVKFAGDGTSPASPERGPQKGAGDDYGAMYEVLARRFRRSREAELNEGDGNVQVETQADGRPARSVGWSTEEAEKTRDRIDWELPDLFVVDGGRGQLAVALAAARDLGLHDLPIVALAKEKENVMGETLVDRVYLPGQKNPIALKSHSASLFFLARVRDEAHRFSNRARERLGKARRMRSVLDDVPGIGPQTKKALLRALGSLAAIQKADDATILAVPGVQPRHLKALRAIFPAPEPRQPDDTSAN
jgi:excinuclease ABC subunit C